MPKALRVTVTAAGISGAVTVVLALALAHRSGVGPPGELGAFTALLGASWAFPLLVLRREETEAFQLDEAFLVAMALLLPPLGTVVAFGLAAVLTQLARRRPLSRIAFNTGMVLTATGLALAAMHLAGAVPGGEASPRDMVAVVLGAAVFLVVNGASVSVVISVAEGRSFWRTWSDGLAFRLLVWAASVAIGLLAGLAGSAFSWALLLAVLPMGVLQVVLAGSLRARLDREHLDALLRTALQAHASVKLGDVEEALTVSARELLRCRASRIGETAPGPEELGSRIPGRGSDERWLVVSGRRGVEPLGDPDARLLDAIVAVGSSALENASLVEQMRHQVFHDALTGMPNQLLFEERVDAALAHARRSGEKLAVLFVDLDRFKRVNDCLGHPAGNALLRQVANRIRATVRADDTVARMGGDEFTLLVEGIRSTRQATLVAEKLLDAFRRPFLLGGERLFVTPSVGVAVSPEAGTRPSSLLKNADTAMYRAKERGRNCYEVYATDMSAGAHSRLTLEGDLHNALDAGQLRVVYQPQVDLASGQVVGVEALARWTHPVLGAVGPETFIPLAEETGLIVSLDDWVLRTACAQGRAWTESGAAPLRISVNLSGLAFQRSRVVERVAETIARTGLEPACLELEVTESMAVDQVSDTRPVFRALEALGVRLALDDFGTGYSALSRLQGFPFHTLKIDRSFVAQIGKTGDEAPIVAAMIAMAHALNLAVVAEGVETLGQGSFLARHGCDMAQGYLFGRPVEAIEVEKMLQPAALPA